MNERRSYGLLIFEGEWEQCKLEDYATYRRGSFPQPYGNKKWYDGENAMPFVQVIDVTEQLSLVKDTKQKISKLSTIKKVFFGIRWKSGSYFAREYWSCCKSLNIIHILIVPAVF